jgi:hypothetical protein
MNEFEINKDKNDYLLEEHRALFNKLSVESKIFIVQFAKYIIKMQETASSSFGNNM